MRTRNIIVNGTEYVINRAVSVDIAIEARGMKVTDLNDKTRVSTQLILALLHEMMVAGAKWARLNGQEDAPEPPSEEKLADMLDQDDLTALIPPMMEVIMGVRNVQAKPTKKAKAGESGESPAR